MVSCGSLYCGILQLLQREYRSSPRQLIGNIFSHHLSILCILILVCLCVWHAFQLSICWPALHTSTCFPRWLAPVNQLSWSSLHPLFAFQLSCTHPSFYQMFISQPVYTHFSAVSPAILHLSISFPVSLNH